jgi:hypothetical protein
MLADCSPADIRELGNELVDRSESASIRAGVSRLYYANHLHAIETIVPKYGIQLQGRGDDHGAIVKWLKNRGGRMKTWSERLSKLRTYREHADYHVNGLHRGNDCLICMGKLKVEAMSTVKEEAKLCFDALSSL